MNPTRRRLFGSAAGAAALLLAPAARLLASAGAARAAPGYGPLALVRDSTTGLELLALPRGFSYASFGWRGEPMHGDAPTPGAHDGMGVVRERGGVATLIRNHEIVTDTGAFGPARIAYDPVAGGGTTTIKFDTASGKGGRARASLSGTLQNCSGGVTPWGTWLSCEEFVYEPAPDQAAAGRLGRLTKPHGFVFEVKPGGAAPRPLVGLGQFRHEAAAVHEPSGHVYLTEDREPCAGFYRFVPARREKLAGRGTLEMLKLVQPRELRGGLPQGQEFAVEWVRIDDPARAHSPGTRDGLGVFMQGHERGGAAFTRGEGCYATRDAVYFTASNGGAAACGQVFAYYPVRRTLALVFESPDSETLDFPDNLCFSPRGGLVLCEDGTRDRKLLQGLSAAGGLFPFARNEVVLHGAPYGHTGDFRAAEWAGACYSRDGRWLFANVFRPGFSVAITGPWRSGLI